MGKKITDLRRNRMNFIQLSSFILTAFFLLSFVENTSAQKPNFSGSWTFNQQKSDLGQQAGGGGGRGFGGGAGGNLTIRHDGNNLVVDRIIMRQGEERTNTSKYTLDGKETENTMGNRGSSKSVAKWSADNKSLTISTTSSFEMEGQTRESKNNEIWTLTDGGKTLTINSTRATPQGERKMKLVYDKK
jgi:hypothetical protein